MRIEVIIADTIDAAVDRILIELGVNTRSSRQNVIYFDGWEGLGASAVLQAVAERLATIPNEPATAITTRRLPFEHIINIDCSKWESRRAVQRKIAEQLKLSDRVMQMFDKQDEEDDFNGLGEGSRDVVAQVVRETSQVVKNSRFLVILHNGGNEEIDIFSFGLYLDTYMWSKMLWTFQGDFRLDPKMTDKVTKSTITHLLLSAACSSDNEGDTHRFWSYLVRHEAAQLSCNNRIRKHGDSTIIIDPAIAADCFLYMLKQCNIGSQIIDYDWGIHTSNYWICDGIIPPAQLGAEIEETDMTWEYSDALQQEIRLNTDGAKEGSTLLHPQLARSMEKMPYWFSTLTSGFVLSPSGVIPSKMFLRHSEMLGVLKLSRCSFSFSSPPFLCCHSLRFLCLVLCSSTDSSSSDNHHTDTDAADNNKEVEEELWECFQSLWVLDLRYTDWDQILSAQVMDIMTQLRELNVMGAKSWNMSRIRGRLRNVRKLRVTKSTCRSDDGNLFPEMMESLELLDFSGNRITPNQPRGMPRLSAQTRSSTGLKTVIIDGCDGLKTISLSGCRELKRLVLKGRFWSLEVLDLSGIGVKTLDLREVNTPALGQLILLGCEKLRQVFWAASRLRVTTTIPGVLRIDTTTSTTTSASASASAATIHGDRSLQQHQQQKEEKFNQWQISLADARLLRSLDDAIYQLNNPSLHVDICSGGSRRSVDDQTRSSRHKPALLLQATSKYRNVLKDVNSIYDCRDVMMMWDCPEIPLKPSAAATCIIKVMMPVPQGQGQPAGNNKRLLSEDATTCTSSRAPLSLPRATCHTATSLHMYDNSSITGISAPPPQWPNLMWCRVERCPELHTLFTTPGNSDGHLNGFNELKTFWASQLLTARCILTDALHTYPSNLAFLHLDCCPRLIHVLPFSMSMAMGTSFQYLLETLEIVYCGDLREVFHFVPPQDTLAAAAAANNKVDFPRLRRIHLHELPMLHHICPCTIYAPNLEIIKIRGCWSLRRLPVIGANIKPPMVDCEKEWWDKLEWDRAEVYHHPSLYRPTHSRHYKDALLPRGTLLR